MDIQDAISNFKKLIEDSIRKDGSNGITATIRSSEPIFKIHEAVKHELISKGINKDLICPSIGSNSPELKLAGKLKQKDQDICIKPNNVKKCQEKLTEKPLDGIKDEYGIEFTRKTLVINVRSQISSIQKNFDTLFERTYAEALNLHARCPDMVLGEVYLLAVPEYDTKAFSNKLVKFKKKNQELAKKYIKSFQAITNRKSTKKDYYKYESICLLIVDFSQTPPKFYNTTNELETDGLLPKNSTLKYENLSWGDFFNKLLKIYHNRFNISTIK
ncbi:restriction endonuclease [Campylobacter concisus]|uniref:restriction endonuclease n=1 Tax=Campylobacter concisus TaxID=199 RepID=UPI000CD8E3DD|nr:restriction endonuclease [Campylobacter concisus]